MPKQKLKPCPFCGNDKDGTIAVWFGTAGTFIKCDNCGSTGPHKKADFPAINAWNRRTNA